MVTSEVCTLSFAAYKVKRECLINDLINDLRYMTFTLLELIICNKEKKLMKQNHGVEIIFNIKL